MSADVPATPPQAVRAVTHEDLARDLGRNCARWRGEDYTSLRNIETRMEAHHLAQMEQLGILARAIRPRRTFWEWLTR